MKRISKGPWAFSVIIALSASLGAVVSCIDAEPTDDGSVDRMGTPSDDIELEAELEEQDADENKNPDGLVSEMPDPDETHANCNPPFDGCHCSSPSDPQHCKDFGVQCRLAGCTWTCTQSCGTGCCQGDCEC